MDVEKLRNLTDAELLHQQQELNDQLFRLKFQLKMGQTESLTKIRGLRKDVARVHTVIREKELGIAAPSNGHKTEAAAGDAEPKPKTKTGRCRQERQEEKDQGCRKGQDSQAGQEEDRSQSEEEVNGRDNTRKNKAAAAPRLAA